MCLLEMTQMVNFFEPSRPICYPKLTPGGKGAHSSYSQYCVLFQVKPGTSSEQNTSQVKAHTPKQNRNKHLH